MAILHGFNARDENMRDELNQESPKISNEETETGKGTGSTIKMLENALKVMDALRDSKTPLGVNELAKQCTLSPSTTFRILKTLQADEWVFQFSDSGYLLGEKVSFVTEQNNMFLALKDVSGTIMQKYTNENGHAMNLMVRDGSNCTILQQSRTKNLIDYVPPIGTQLPIYACAGGKVLLSQLPIARAEQIIDAITLTAITPNTITDSDALWKNLRQVSTQGYAIENRESSLNGSCIAVPVWNSGNNAIAALSFSGFILEKDADASLVQYLPALKKASKEISESLFTAWKF